MILFPVVCVDAWAILLIFAWWTVGEAPLATEPQAIVFTTKFFYLVEQSLVKLLGAWETILLLKSLEILLEQSIRSVCDFLRS